MADDLICTIERTIESKEESKRVTLKEGILTEFSVSEGWAIVPEEPPA